jgi:uncharacterized protein
MSERPKIVFPCDYPIRVIGRNTLGFRQSVVRVVRAHAPDLDEATVTVRDSRDESFRSVRFSIRATGEVQLRALHRALLELPAVKLVL